MCSCSGALVESVHSAPFTLGILGLIHSLITARTGATRQQNAFWKNRTLKNLLITDKDLHAFKCIHRLSASLKALMVSVPAFGSHIPGSNPGPGPSTGRYEGRQIALWIVNTTVVDPDPNWIHFQDLCGSVFQIRIRIQTGKYRIIQRKKV